ncbi:MAG: hypothetical protein ACYC1D_00460 [Acidimicrobiales bacterium]
MTPERLGAALLAQAEGAYAAEAAVGLLIEHRSWLARADFVRFVDVAHSFHDDRVVMASVDWEAALAANLAASSSETQMLAVAAELAGVDTGRSLQDLLGGLDRTNTTLVIRAVLHAQRGANTSAVTVTPFSTVGRRAETNARPDRSEAPSAGGWAEPEGPGL